MNGRKRTEGRTPNLEPRTLLTARSPAKTGTLKNFNLNLLGKSACGSLSPINHLLTSKTARVVEWQTRTFEGRMPKGMRVQVPPRAPPNCLLPRLAKKLRVLLEWTPDLLFGREVEQMMTLRDAELIADRLARVHARNMQKYANAPANCSAITCREAAAWSDQLNKLTPSKFLTQLLSRIARIFQWRD